VVGALGAQAIRERELPIESADVEPGRDRGQLMNHHLRGSRLHHGHHSAPVERIGDRGDRPRRADRVDLGVRARHGDHRVARLDEQRDESPPDRAAGPGHEHLHPQGPPFIQTDAYGGCRQTIAKLIGKPK
jgi:hypothetical protein